jgi:hypothetical protein
VPPWLRGEDFLTNFFKEGPCRGEDSFRDDEKITGKRKDASLSCLHREEEKNATKT